MDGAQYLRVQDVAVIGAGVSGVAAAVHLRRLGLSVTLYERSQKVGGIWVYDERVSKDASFPSTIPSWGDSPEFDSQSLVSSREDREDSPMKNVQQRQHGFSGTKQDLLTSFAPPGPCYITLQNNVSTIEMEMTCQAWREGTAEFVPHYVLAQYIQDAASSNGIMECTQFNTRVNKVEKDGSKWRLTTATIEPTVNERIVRQNEQSFDAVVVASGHYHACNVPDLPGLSRLKETFPSRVMHSKLYRRPSDFENQNVLLIGSGVSSMDIARNLDGIAKSVYQSSRGGPYDIPSHLLPQNAARISGIERFEIPGGCELKSDGSMPVDVVLTTGQKLCNLHYIIVCTGYHISLPFMRQYHADDVNCEDADETVLVTSGQQTHNLHKDIWYIPDPTLAFIGMPYHTATFSLFEFQAMALSAVFAGKAPLPAEQAMREEYTDRLNRKSAGRFFHSLRKEGDEISYVNELVQLVNASKIDQESRMIGHTQRWLEAYDRRRERMAKLYSTQRDPALDDAVMGLMSGCS